MEKFLRNWNFKKHFIAVSSFYAIIQSVGCILFMKKNCKQCKTVKSKKLWNSTKKDKELCKEMALDYVRNIPDKQKTFHGIIAACYLVDLSSYLIIAKLKKKLL